MKYNPPLGAIDPNEGFTNGDPSAGIAASPIPAAALEQPQREIVNAIIAAGLEPNGADLGQLSAAITALSEGAQKFASNPQSDAGDAGDVALTPHNFGSQNSKVGGGGYQVFPGGLILQWGQASAPSAGTTIMFPIAFPSAAFCVIVSDRVGQVSNPVYSQAVYDIEKANFGAKSTAGGGAADVFHYIAIGH